MTSFLLPLAFTGVSYRVETIAAIALFSLLTLGMWKLIIHPFWGPRLRLIVRHKFALLCLAGVSFFVLVAFFDAVAWRDIQKGNSVSLEATKARSLLDRLYAGLTGVPEYAYRERSYSAPLAKHEFIDRDIELNHRHLLGTTQTGHDTLYKTLKGCKPAIVIGALPLLIAIPLALLVGIAAGFFGGRIDDLVVYLYTTLASIPRLLLLIALITALGHGLLQIAVGLGVTGWIGLCRLVRGETFKLREMEYIQAAVCLGVSRWQIIRRHIVPNLMHIVIITSILAFTGLVLSESILAYLGIGLEHSWGAMIDNARSELSRDPAIWWNMVFASSALFLLVLCVNVVGDAVRDLLDPRVSSEGANNG